MMFILESVADRQAVWSETANTLKSATDRARYTTFIASFLGALLAALATLDQDIGVYLAALSAVSLGLVTFVTTRWLNKAVIDRHLRARIASEALKRESYLYATQSGPYLEPHTRDAILLNRKTEIENQVSDLLLFEQEAKGPGSCPRKDMDLKEYLEHRVDRQIKYYRDKSSKYNTYSQRLHTMEWVFSLVAALIAALAAATTVNFAAIAAVLTTLAGIVVSHLEATRFDKLIPAYRITASQLENIKLKMQIDQNPSTDCVMEFEAVLATENTAWQELWAKSDRENKNDEHTE